MESAVSSFALTVQRQLKDVEATLARIEAHERDEFEEIDIADVDIDDPAFEPLLVGRKVKVLLGDVDLIRWKQDLIEDRNRLATLHAAASRWTAARDDKLLQAARDHRHKCRNPINPGNRKSSSSPPSPTPRVPLRPLWRLGQGRPRHRIALVTGSGRNQTTLPACART
jgi:hypothetical protein